MKLAPRMIQSMEILQLASAALEERIEQELSSNPTLELREPGPDAEDLAQQLDQDQRDSAEGERELVVADDNVDANHADDFERLNNLSEEIGGSWESDTWETGDAGPYRRVRDSGERDAKMDAMANTAARPRSLNEQLREQWHMVEAPAEVRAAGELIIDQLDEDGYFRTPFEQLLRVAPAAVGLEDLERALEMVQRALEPAGIAARDLRECLLLQMDAAERLDPDLDLSHERLLVSDYLKDIEANRLPRIAKATGLSIDQINAAKANLRHLHPHPGRNLVADSPQRITPDAYIEYDEDTDRYVARLWTDRLPNLQINPRYLKLAKDRQVDRKTREFVGNNLRSARWLLDAIEQRHATLLRVINVVVDAQRDFLDNGKQYLKPLPMTQVADQLGIHVATVSRAVNEKYIQTPRGIFPLRMFFSGGTETESGDAMSWTAVQAKLKTIIDAEDKSNPDSDDQLVDKLKAEGIDIARRTVAKYRKQLGIAPARQRRQY